MSGGFGGFGFGGSSPATAAGVGAIPSSYLDTDGTLAANSDLKVATQKAIVTYVASLVAGLFDIKGSTDASANPNYPVASKGDVYVISVAGKVGGASGKIVEVGDTIVATADNAGGTEASVGTSWIVIQSNIASITANGLSLIQAADYTAMKVLLALTIGTNVAAYNANAVFLNVATVFTAQQNFGAVAITSASASIAWNLATAQTATHTMTENTTLANPTNMVSGGTYILIITQHASSAKTLAFGSAYKTAGAAGFTMSVGVGAIDILTFVSNGTIMGLVGQKAFA